MKKINTLGKTQLFWFFAHSQIGIGLLSLPYSLYKEVESDGWISLLLAAVLVQIAITILALLHKRFPSDTLFGICEKTVGRFVGKLLIILYIAYFIHTAALVLKGFAQLIAVWILTKTPEPIFIVLIIGACLPVFFSSLRQIARMLVLTAPIILLIPLVTIYAFFQGDYLNLLPLGVASPSAITKGVFSSMFAINGFIVLSIIFPHVKATPFEKWKVVTLAHWFVTLIYLIVVIASFITFSHGEMKLLPEPFLYMIKSFSLALIERIDLIFLSLWSVIAITTYIIFVYCGTIGIMTTFHTKRYRLIIVVCLILTAAIALIPTSIFEFYEWVKVNNQIASVLTFVIPLVLLIVSIIWKRRAVS